MSMVGGESSTVRLILPATALSQMNMAGFISETVRLIFLIQGSDSMMLDAGVL